MAMIVGSYSIREKNVFVHLSCQFIHSHPVYVNLQLVVRFYITSVLVIRRFVDFQHIVEFCENCLAESFVPQFD